MIDPKELRIGNIVMVNKCFTRVFSIANDGINHTIDNLGHAPIVEFEKLLTLSGIELTPEILEKCGTYKSNRYKNIMPDTWHFIGSEEGNTNFIVIDHHNKIWYVYADFEHDGQVSFEISFLHQLQNHVFSNTGEELTYTS